MYFVLKVLRVKNKQRTYVQIREQNEYTEYKFEENYNLRHLIVIVLMSEFLKRYLRMTFFPYFIS